MKGPAIFNLPNYVILDSNPARGFHCVDTDHIFYPSDRALPRLRSTTGYELEISTQLVKLEKGIKNKQEERNRMEEINDRGNSITKKASRRAHDLKALLTYKNTQLTLQMPNFENFNLYENIYVYHHGTSVGTLSQVQSQEIFGRNIFLHLKFLEI
jgi:hypothetical protein